MNLVQRLQMSVNKYIGEYLLDYRLKNGISQRQLGKIIKASQSQISKWEAGINKPTRLREKDIFKILEEARGDGGEIQKLR